MQHVSTYSSRLQAKLRTVIALQSGCAHLGSNMAYSILLRFFVSNVTYIYCAIISHIAYKKKTAAKYCKPYGIPNAHNHPVKQ